MSSSSTTLPARTRSLRRPPGKPTNESIPKPRRAAAPLPQPIDTQSGRRSVETSTEQAIASPSRLPTVKPRSATLSHGRPLSVSSIGSVKGSMGPPPRPSSIHKPINGLTRSSSSRYSTSSTASEPVKEERARPAIVSRHLRNVSTNSTPTPRSPGHTRTQSTSTLSSSSTALRQSAHPHPADQSRSVNPQLRKPAFSTLQQHFSPAKNLAPKPLTAAYFAPPTPSKLPSNIAISAETAKLQSELLQLHILHRHAERVQQDWKGSARRKLEAKFQTVVQRNANLVETEVGEVGKLNAAALRDWSRIGLPSLGLEERIQALDEVLTGVWNMGASGGKYSKVIRRFEKWLSRCQEILDERERGEEYDTDEPVFIEGMDKAWKDDCLVLGRKLEMWRDKLNYLGLPEEDSSLASILRGCRSLVHGMLLELSVMARIEGDAVTMELAWIKRMNDTTGDEENMPAVGAVWRTR